MTDDHTSADGHDDHGPPPEDPRWVLVPLVVGLVIGVVVLAVLGFGSGAVPVT